MIYRGAACQLVVWLGYRVSSSSSGIISASLLSGTGTIFRCRHVDPLFCVCSCILVCLHHFFNFGGGLAAMGSNFTYLASKTRRSGDLRGGQRTVPEFETQTIEREDCRACRK